MLKNKIERLKSKYTTNISKEYTPNKSVWFHIAMILSAIPFFSIPIYVDFTQSFLPLILFGFLILFIPISWMFLESMSYSYHYLFVEKRNPFKAYFEENQIEKELIQLFGSVDNAISVYKELILINPDFSDSDILKMISLPDKVKNKKEIINNQLENKLHEIDLKIDKLEESKKELRKKYGEKKNHILNKNLLASPEKNLLASPEKGMSLFELLSRFNRSLIS